MSESTPLTADRLRRRCDPAALGFSTTADLEPLVDAVGQDRALDALRFAVGMRGEGYNLFAMGPTETGKHEAVRRVLKERAAREEAPRDVCYVHDFLKPDRPKALVLPPGTGRVLREEVSQLVEDLRVAIPAALESDEQRQRKQAIEEEVKQAHDRAFSELREEAEKVGIALLHTPMGFAFAPVKDGEILPPEDFDKLPEEEQERLEKETERLQAGLQTTIARLRGSAKEARSKVRALLREVTTAAVGHLIDELRTRHAGLPEVVAHLDALQEDVVDNVEDFLGLPEGASLKLAASPDLGALSGPVPLRRYLVNLFVDNSALEGAPVVHEDNPTFDNLFGSIEHLAQQGALVTDLHLVKPGALHRANGGYLVLDARELLLQPFAYDGLKRALRAGEARVETLGRQLSIVSTVSLEPEPVPLSVKVVLVGERMLYYLLDEHDPDFRALFKVVADFDDELERDEEAEGAYARFVATTVRSEELLPFDAAAVARVIDRGARLAEDSERLSARVGRIGDLLREADHWAREAGRDVVGAGDVKRAVEESERRAGRIKERLLEEVARGTLRIETEGERVGQVNGLSVLRLGDLDFGRPARISCTARLGSGGVVDIEREVELGGPLHSKGVLILQGVLGSRYAPEHPLSLGATLVFEQSYGPIDGDSASLAELCALLSAIGKIPLKQCFAMTGSVDQDGRAQAIGGVNAKIEGYFEACRALGGVEGRGVLIPAANVKHLMLSDEVVEACERGEFAVHAVETVDEAMELLTGLQAGRRGKTGSFPKGSVNARVEERLIELAERRLELGRGSGGDGEKP